MSLSSLRTLKGLISNYSDYSNDSNSQVFQIFQQKFFQKLQHRSESKFKFLYLQIRNVNKIWGYFLKNAFLPKQDAKASGLSSKAFQIKQDTLMYTHVYTCTLMYTHVYSCILMYTLVQNTMQMRIIRVGSLSEHQVFSWIFFFQLILTTGS